MKENGFKQARFSGNQFAPLTESAFSGSSQVSSTSDL